MAAVISGRASYTAKFLIECFVDATLKDLSRESVLRIPAYVIRKIAALCMLLNCCASKIHGNISITLARINKIEERLHLYRIPRGIVHDKIPF